jgi:hypothetical protein
VIAPIPHAGDQPSRTKPGADAGTMRGVVLTGPQRLAVADVPRPQSQPGTAIIRVQACGICGTHVVGYRQRANAEQRPGGHEFAGDVMEIAPRPGEQTRVRVGDLVAVDTPGLGARVRRVPGVPPALIARCTGPADVIEAVAFARERGPMPLARPMRPISKFATAGTGCWRQDVEADALGSPQILGDVATWEISVFTYQRANPASA